MSAPRRRSPDATPAPRLRKAERKRQLLACAKQLFVSHGYHNVSIRKIAERIEYSPAAIYSYFPSKDDIFFALAEEGFQLLASSATEPPAGQDPDSDHLQDTLRAFELMSKDEKFAEDYAKLLGDMVYGEKPEFSSAFEKLQRFAERIREA